MEAKMAGVNSGIPLFYVEQFSSNIQLKVQQKGSRLSQAVMSGNHVGSQASPVDQFGAINANKVEGRYQPIVATDAPTDRRWVFPQDYDLAQLLDNFDKLRLLIDPMSSYVTNAVYALGRAKDQEIINGLLGTNYVGNNGTSTTSITSGQTVNVAQGAASATNLTVAKLRKGMQILRTNEALQDDAEVYMAINGINHDSLLAEVQVVSSDFNGGTPVLVDGKIMRFMGVNFIHTELLNTGTDDASGTSTACPMWVKSGAYAGIWQDIMTDVSQRKDLRSLPYQAYVMGTFGGTRLEEKKVVQVWAR
jgi:hypothetical protein